MYLAIVSNANCWAYAVTKTKTGNADTVVCLFLTVKGTINNTAKRQVSSETCLFSLLFVKIWIIMDKIESVREGLI